MKVRRFLNSQSHGGAAYAMLRVTPPVKRKSDFEGLYDIAEFTMADCTRSITLEFPMDTAKDRHHSLVKARLIRDLVCQFTRELEQVASVAIHAEKFNRALYRKRDVERKRARKQRQTVGNV